MIKAFYILMETNVPDNQCILEFEHAVGEIQALRAKVIKRINPIDEDPETNDN